MVRYCPGAVRTISGPQRSGRRDVVVVAAVATVVRAVVVVAWGRTPTGLFDPAIYAGFARSIAAGDGYSSLLGQPTTYYPPGYPLFLGAVQWVLDRVGLGEHLATGAGLVQALLGGVAAGAAVVAGRRLGAALPGGAGSVRTVGLVAGLVLALWPNLVLYTATLLSEPLFVAALAVFLAALLSVGDLRSPAPGIVAIGLLALGLAALTRPQVLLVVPAVAVAWSLAGVGVRRVLGGTAVLLAATAVVVVPWTVRNAVVMGHLVVLSTNGGDNLCIGFHDGATGGFVLVDECATDERYVDGPDAEVRRDRELQERATTWIREHPGQLPSLSIRKLAVTFGDDRDSLRALQSFGEDEFVPRGIERVLGTLFDLAWFGLAAGAIAGAVRLLGRDVRRSPAAQVVLWATAAGVVVPVLFFGDPRFKLSLAPLMALLAGVSAWWVVDLVGARTRSPGAAPVDAGADPRS